MCTLANIENAHMNKLPSPAAHISVPSFDIWLSSYTLSLYIHIHTQATYDSVCVWVCNGIAVNTGYSIHIKCKMRCYCERESERLFVPIIQDDRFKMKWKHTCVDVARGRQMARMLYMNKNRYSTHTHAHTHERTSCIEWHKRQEPRRNG